MKYAALVLGLLASWGVSVGCEQPDGIIEYDKCAERGAYGDTNASINRSKQESEEYYQRTQPVQVITPDSSYLAYPSGDGRTVQVYGGIGKGFDRD